MDEIGRQALTNAFINFIRDTTNPAAYRDSLIYEDVPHEDLKTGIQKCPSAPNIAHHKLDPPIATINPQNQMSLVSDIKEKR